MWKFSNDWIVPMVVMMHTVMNLRNESNIFSVDRGIKYKK